MESNIRDVHTDCSHYERVMSSCIWIYSHILKVPVSAVKAITNIDLITNEEILYKVSVFNSNNMFSNYSKNLFQITPRANRFFLKMLPVGKQFQAALSITILTTSEIQVHA